MERQDWEKLVVPDTDALTYVKRGVLWVAKQPHYIVELLREEDMAYVMVYKAHPNTTKEPRKFAVLTEQNDTKFSPNSLLGTLANKLKSKKQPPKWVVKPPLFIAPIVQNQVDTFTGKREAGFFEREEDKVTARGGEKVFIRGNNTGVFIGLSSISWEDKVHIPVNSLVDAMKAARSNGGFYDFESREDKSKDIWS